MVEMILIFLGGIAVGLGGSVAIKNMKKKPAPPPVVVKSHEGTEQAIKNLTNLDITKPICEPEYIKDHSDLLCRELTCLQFSRGLDSQTGGQQCESISNIANKIHIEKWCNQYQDEALKQDCIDIFWKRN